MRENRLKRKLVNKQIFKGLLVALSAMIIMCFMPRSEKQGYEYRIGYPWLNKQLVAPFTFAILKSDSLIIAERDSVCQQFKPYYHVENNVSRLMKNKLLTKTKDWTGPNSDLYIEHVMVLLDSVYRRGVIDPEEHDSLIRKKQSTVKLVVGKTATNIDVKNLFTPRTAYEYIMNADTAMYSKLVLQHFNLGEVITTNLKYDKRKSEAELKDMLSAISGASGMVIAGTKIIDRGENVDANTARIIDSYIKSSNTDSGETIWRYKFGGQFILVVFVLLTLLSYLNLFREDYFDDAGPSILLFGLLTIFCCTAGWMVKHNFFHIMILPCCMVPIIIRVFMDSRTAYMFHCAMIIIIASFLHEPFEFMLLQLTTGMVAIQTLRELSQRSQIIRTAAVITITYMVIHTAIILIQVQDKELNLDRSIYLYMLVNGLLLLFSYPFLYILEKLFGFVSDVTLVELSNISNPLLQKMSEIAPGTFQHSMQVANLSSEVAKKIKARAQLVRTGALYHDIGKLERPVFFTENQKGTNPHAKLTPERSAQVIIAHVSNGLALADKNNLPQPIKRFITTHHGVGKTKYFYVTWMNEHPGEKPDDAAFTYPGPNPSTKEEAILMMADSVEAASRSLPEYTEQSISTLVDKIIDGQVKEGFFSECDITFKDIAIAKDVFKEKLQIVYHTRISYPELNNKK